jgi:hypothetical protein
MGRILRIGRFMRQTLRLTMRKAVSRQTCVGGHFFEPHPRQPPQTSDKSTACRLQFFIMKNYMSAATEAKSGGGANKASGDSAKKAAGVNAPAASLLAEESAK